MHLEVHNRPKARKLGLQKVIRSLIGNHVHDDLLPSRDGRLLLGSLAAACEARLGRLLHAAWLHPRQLRAARKAHLAGRSRARQEDLPTARRLDGPGRFLAGLVAQEGVGPLRPGVVPLHLHVRDHTVLCKLGHQLVVWQVCRDRGHVDRSRNRCRGAWRGSPHKGRSSWRSKLWSALRRGAGRAGEGRCAHRGLHRGLIRCWPQ
mmetsp:Transcript_95393/g.278939  ORF Transcript_95393/g.278939 Transcript_95393/m.278939 type:complete len:205 (-) Transcript_95393:450-1064(-)